MNKYLKEFIFRGLIFGGFGPIVLGIIYFILFKIYNISFDGSEVLTGILSTYILAFIHAGASLFNQIEEWPIMKSISYHFVTLYIAYTLCYLVNSWITFEFKVFIIYTIIFIVIYVLIWIIVLIITKKQSKKFNKALK